MPIVKILCTLLLVAVLVYCMLKKMYNITTIMGIGVVALLIYTIATGTSIMGEKTCGNNILDVFEFVATSFTSAFANPGLLIVVLVGFAGYMKEIGASEMLVTLACTPLRKIKSTYVICAIAFVIGAIIKLPITSPSGFSALMMITMVPIMVSCGVNPITAAATIALSQGCDWGPGDMGTGICIPVIAPEHQMADYFLSYNLPTYIFIIPVLAVVAPIVYRIIDKKEGLYGVSEAEGIQIKSVKEVGVPTYYALLPLLPIVFVLLFSKIGLKTVVMTTQGCTMLALFIAIVIELIRHPKEVMGTIQRTSAYFTSMGGAFASVVVLVASANCFAKADIHVYHSRDARRLFRNGNCQQCYCDLYMRNPLRRHQMHDREERTEKHGLGDAHPPCGLSRYCLRHQRERLRGTDRQRLYLGLRPGCAADSFPRRFGLCGNGRQ